MLLSATIACRTESSVPDPEPSAAATEAPLAPAPAGPSPTIARGKELVVSHECARCHEGAGAPPPATEKACFGCHADIVSGARKGPKPKHWAARVAPSRFAPSLSGVGTLTSVDWTTRYLLAPHDVRPALVTSMPRLALTETDARSIALYLASSGKSADVQPAAGGDLDRGRTAFTLRGCVSCHELTGARLGSRPEIEPDAPADRVLAPDLAFTRERTTEAIVASFLRDPTSIKPDAQMPKQALDEQTIADLAAFVMRTPLDSRPARARFSRLPLLEREVGYDEVAARVFQRTCWHCHSQPDSARGDGGPGNSGGFGFRGPKLDLSSYESILAGFVDQAGQRRSLFSKAPGSADSVLVASIVARHDEERGVFGPMRGMPLAYPALTAEEVQLVESWVKQGHRP